MVKVSVEEETLASPVSEELTSKTTFPVGCVPKTTVNVSVVSVSLTLVEPPVSATVYPALSIFVTVTLKF